MKKLVTSTAICLFSMSLFFVGVLTTNPALGMGPEAENAKVDMHQLSPLAEKWFTQQSGSYISVLVLKDNKAGTFLFKSGVKPREVADHEHAPAAMRIKFYNAGDNKWSIRTSLGSGQVEINTLLPQIEQLVTEKAGKFRAIVVFKSDGTFDVFRAKTQQILRDMVLVDQKQELVQNVSVHRMPGQGEDGHLSLWCECYNGRWFWF